MWRVYGSKGREQGRSKGWWIIKWMDPARKARMGGDEYLPIATKGCKGRMGKDGKGEGKGEEQERMKKKGGFNVFIFATMPVTPVTK